MIRITRWSPDTCECVIDYEWDDSVPQNLRTHSISKVIKKCSLHQIVPTEEDNFNVVTDENQRKNKVMGDIVDNLPALTKLDENGNKLLKDGVIQWYYDSDRVLHIIAPTLSAIEKKDIEGLSDSKYDVGKVKVN